MRKPATTEGRNFRTFLLMAQFEAKEIGARIAQARRESGLTQEQLVEMASFSKRSLGDYETGVTIPYRHLRELGKLLDRPTEWFLYGDEEKPAALDPREVMDKLDRQHDEVMGRLDAIEEQIRVTAATETALPVPPPTV